MSQACAEIATHCIPVRLDPDLLCFDSLNHAITSPRIYFYEAPSAYIQHICTLKKLMLIKQLFRAW